MSDLCLGRACRADHVLSRSSSRWRESLCAGPRRFHGTDAIAPFQAVVRRAIQIGNSRTTRSSYAPLDALKKAVAARDEKAFGAQFDKLTTACNACHEATHLNFVRIIVPTSSPFSNQIFTKDAKLLRICRCLLLASLGAQR
jgi:hypothetical protein